MNTVFHFQERLIASASNSLEVGKNYALVAEGLQIPPAYSAPPVIGLHLGLVSRWRRALLDKRRECVGMPTAAKRSKIVVCSRDLPHAVRAR